ncbi:MAG: 3-deoxy-D-manno-octulosonic acid transferase [Fimbriimonadaceae bacterium]|nr:3-deoxy-D-manno-octulosonic acid transferase [Fimbriimonadaceae bacterium]
MIFAIYNALLILFAPFWGTWMILRARKRQEAPNWGERLGDYRIPKSRENPRLFLHAVSVGEVVAALPILKAVRERLPSVNIVLSVTTSSGHATAREKAEGLFDHLVYAPIDLPRATMNAMLRTQPDVMAFMETELWFNWLWMAKQYDAHTMLINGRISDRSFPRSRSLKFFYKPLLKLMDEVLAQTQTDADRLRVLGAGEPEVIGNCKYDQAAEGTEADPESLRTMYEIQPGEQVIVVGSTRGEEEELLVAGALADPRLSAVRVIWAPRHLERVDAIVSRLGDVGRRSHGTNRRITLLDTYGELSQVYAVADVVVIGGGFAPLGGQNLIQPMAHGKPVLHGPHMMNFRDVSEEARRVSATSVASTPEELAEQLVRLLSNPEQRESMGRAGRELVERHRGASQRYADRIIAGLLAQRKVGSQ